MAIHSSFNKCFVLLAFLIPVACYGQDPIAKEYIGISTGLFGSSQRHWYGIHDKSNIINPRPNQPRYKDTEITKIADNILLYQRNNGGWPKNYDVLAILTDDQKDSLIKNKEETHTTFDNTTTYSHIEYLARVYTVTKIEKYKEACLKGIDFTLAAQYANGGWPQYYPLENNYSRRITFNDGVYIGIMQMLKDILDNEPYYAFIDKSKRQQIKAAFDKGLDCLLKLQIKDNDVLTAWAQQHSEIDLTPAWARAFEPPSICDGESAGVVLFLMSLNNPDANIKNAIESAVKWFQESKIKGIRVNTIKAPALESQWRTSTTDKVVVNDSSAPPIWTRYYELGTHKPLFCDRNSKYLYSLAEVSRERRSGYNWYTYDPQEVLDKYPAWEAKWKTEKKAGK
jgi:PelA/Pel-15E family pectate lyase